MPNSSCNSGRALHNQRPLMNHCAVIHRRILKLGLASLLIGFSLTAPATPPSTEILPPGYRPVPPGVHALTDATVVLKPGKVLPNATVIIRDGLIESVGTDAKVPADARTWDMKGLTVYAGFIDPYLSLGAKAPERPAAPADEQAGTDFTAGGTIKFFGLNPQTRETPG